MYRSKTLKLTNAFLLEFFQEEDFEQLQSFQALIEQTELHIRQKGAQAIGPLIQRTELRVDEDGEPQIAITFIRQVNTFINHVDAPYRMEALIREADCLYTRFVGEEEHLQLAYNKLQIVGYEEEIPLRGDAYTVFVNQSDEGGTLTADIFMPKANS
ncbi:MAG: hypothetical protein LBS98_05980 [Coriobacteriales bacterium]|nr:hypothetical protein [Coriobacteriales bacterium]